MAFSAMLLMVTARPLSGSKVQYTIGVPLLSIILVVDGCSLQAVSTSEYFLVVASVLMNLLCCCGVISDYL